MCSTFTPDCGYDNSTIVLIGDVHCPKKIVEVDFACTKRLLNLLAEAIINALNARLCARCAIFRLKIKEIPFFCRLVKGFTIWKTLPSQFKMLLEMCIFLASWQVLFRKREM